MRVVFVPPNTTPPRLLPCPKRSAAPTDRVAPPVVIPSEPVETPPSEESNDSTMDEVCEKVGPISIPFPYRLLAANGEFFRGPPLRRYPCAPSKAL